jgi:hypothetical protein
MNKKNNLCFFVFRWNFNKKLESITDRNSYWKSYSDCSRYFRWSYEYCSITNSYFEVRNWFNYQRQLKIFLFSRYSNSSEDKRSNHFFKQSLSLISDDRDKNDCEYDDEQSPNGYSSNSNTTDG